MKTTNPLITVVVGITTLLGVAAIACGTYLFIWGNQQVDAYNRGISAYRTLQMEEAFNAFDESIRSFESSKSNSWLERFVLPDPDPELAALAALHKGKALIRLQRLPEAVDALKLSISYNPGVGYEDMPLYPALRPADRTRLMDQAFYAKYNLELLYKNNLELQETKSDGNKQESDEEEEKEPIPQLAPGAQPGEGGPNDI